MAASTRVYRHRFLVREGWWENKEKTEVTPEVVLTSLENGVSPLLALPTISRYNCSTRVGAGDLLSKSQQSPPLPTDGFESGRVGAIINLEGMIA